MALRNIRINGDEILRKKSRNVDKIDSRILTILDDMAETMYNADGAGLAGPQIGLLKRLVVIDVDGENLYKMINPVIIKKSEETYLDEEGCLSIPNEKGEVRRPVRVTVKYTDVNGNEQILNGEGLLARCICHELDHLEGVLYIDRIEK